MLIAFSFKHNLVPRAQCSGIIHSLLSFDWSSYCFEVTNQNKADIMLITLSFFLHNFRTKSYSEAMNTPRKIARQRSSVDKKCRICNNDLSQDKHRVNLLGKLLGCLLNREIYS